MRLWTLSWTLTDGYRYSIDSWKTVHLCLALEERCVDISSINLSRMNIFDKKILVWYTWYTYQQFCAFKCIFLLPCQWYLKDICPWTFCIFHYNLETKIASMCCRTISPQIGHIIIEGPQSSQQARCPQGRKAMNTFFSIQILHRISSISLNCSCNNEVSSVQNMDFDFAFFFSKTFGTFFHLRLSENTNERTNYKV